MLVPDGQDIYIGVITSPYKYDKDSKGYQQQREVRFDKNPITRSIFTGRAWASLKGRLTVFSTYYDEVREIVENERGMPSGVAVLKKEYLKRLQDGLLKGVNSNTFEDAVCSLFSSYFPAIRRLDTRNSRLDTRNSKKGDTDLLADLPGGVIIRVQVKHFNPEKGELQELVVKQLADSMESGDHGIIVTSGTISASARKEAEALRDKTVTFIDGQEFVDLLFESIENIPPKELRIFGLTNEVGFLKS